MLLRPTMTPRPTLALALALALTACGVDEAPEAPPLEGNSLYQITPFLCGDDCRRLTLYRSFNGETLELRAYELDDSYAGRARAALTPGARDELDAMIEEQREGELGELPSDIPADSPIVSLWLPALTLQYAQNYPPSGVEDLDTLLFEIFDDLSQCRETARVVPDGDCVQLAWFPE